MAERIKKRRFRPRWWLRNGHLQSMLGQLRPLRAPEYRTESFVFRDGHESTLHWTPRERGPIVIVMPGTECGVHEKHTLGLMKATHRMGGRGLVLPFRGIVEDEVAGRGYHGADDEDLEFLIEQLRDREGDDVPIFVVGCSLGGSAVLHYLARRGRASGVVAAAAVCVPFHIKRVIRKVSSTFGGFYNRRLLWAAKRRYIKSHHRLPFPPVSIEEARAITTLQEFDARVNAPLCGFDDVEAYYRATDARRCLPLVRTPTLLIGAEDDPFRPHDVSVEQLPISDVVRREVQPYGGHLGFLDRTDEGRWVSWLDQRVTRWIERHLPEHT